MDTSLSAQVKITSGVGLCPILFGRSIARCAYSHTLLHGGEDLGDAKIHEEDFPFVEHNVAGIQIVVQNGRLLGMKIMEKLHDQRKIIAIF